VAEHPGNCGSEKSASFAEPGLEKRGRFLHHAEPVPKTKPATCDDCFFRQNELCALELDEACTTFRAADRGLRPERQLAFVFRTERVTTAYAFPQPNV
jgi:hypothetical protein